MSKPEFVEHQICDHGWVYPRADGRKAKCGGPAICQPCARDAAALEASRMFAEDIQRHQYAEPYNVLSQMLDAMKGQLLVVLVNRLGGAVDIPVSEVDATGGWMMHMEVDQARGVFQFKTSRKS